MTGREGSDVGWTDEDEEISIKIRFSACIAAASLAAAIAGSASLEPEGV